MPTRRKADGRPQLAEPELEKLHQRYERLAEAAREALRRGELDTDRPHVKTPQ